MIEKNIVDNWIKEIDEETSNILSHVNTLNRVVNRLNEACRAESDLMTKKNPYIVKRVISHISNGMCRHEAIELTADELNEPVKRVQVLFWQQKNYMSALRLFARKYTAETLKKAGYKTKDIAGLLGVSENHVYKLLKSVPNEWILKNF